ncbi:MAG: hypothetical protein WCK51_00840 [Armatimonadota bacterium]
MYRSTWGAVILLLFSQSGFRLSDQYVSVETSLTYESAAAKALEGHELDWLDYRIDWENTAASEVWTKAESIFRGHRHDIQALMAIATEPRFEENRGPFPPAFQRESFNFMPKDRWLAGASYLCIDGVRGDEPRTFDRAATSLNRWMFHKAMLMEARNPLSPHQARLLLLTTTFSPWSGKENLARLRRMHKQLESRGYNDRFLRLARLNLFVTELSLKSRPAADFAILERLVHQEFREHPGFRQRFLKASLAQLEGELTLNQERFNDFFRQALVLNREMGLGDEYDFRTSLEAMLWYERQNYEKRKEVFGAAAKPIDLDAL